MSPSGEYSCMTARYTVVNSGRGRGPQSRDFAPIRSARRKSGQVGLHEPLGLVGDRLGGLGR